MCENMEKIFKDEKEQGIEQGIEQGKIILVQKKLAKGKSIPIIADELEESVETIERMIKENELK